MNTSSSANLPITPTGMYQEKIGPIPSGLLRQASATGRMKLLEALLTRALESNQPIADWRAVLDQVLGSGPENSAPDSPEVSPPIPPADEPS